ncbi:hypothetical protein GCM10025868_40600 [Angustibacter aerolatus]|uniref:Signal recognition particle SRP54 helical bundle domain-containing protein n=1 Tax=Angustibacter aerolatus TaxID=1162965 RepID=A0ABQ6JQ16_9ACTN|nr:signal recognition particle receptor subunit alpha [Angustibacter aerolatus]GMA88810.1 hypothetical protein GCM10025868_40600 [Angustibacter aerolatus]
MRRLCIPPLSALVMARGAPVLFGMARGAPVPFGVARGAPVLFGVARGAPVLFGVARGAPVLFGMARGAPVPFPVAQSAPAPNRGRRVRGASARARSRLGGSVTARPPPGTRVFSTLSDRLSATFKNLRGKGRLSEADVAATVREIRTALLEADVAVPVVRQFTAAVRERALGAEVSGALNPAQQIVKIVNDEPGVDPRRRDAAAAGGEEPADRDHAGRSAGCGQDDPGGQAWRATCGPRGTRRCWSRPTCSARTR